MVLFLLPIICILAWIFHRLIWMDPLLKRDDLQILSHLHGLDSIRGLLKAHQYSSIVAFQPIRDLSYFYDLFIRDHFGVSTFHLTNFLIWIGIVVLVYKILECLLTRQSTAVCLAALFAVHPIFVDSVAWVAARKHLLSCFFILMATFTLLRYQKKGGSKPGAAILIGASYLFSALSHPINVLWPVWALIYVKCISKENRRPGLLTLVWTPLLFMILGAIANLHYYLTLYPIHTNTSKWLSDSTQNQGIPLLALGRYVFNLLLPVKLALVYYPGSVENLIGFFFIIAGVFLLIKKLGTKRSFPWLAFFFFPLLPVTLVTTNVFVSDTYILTASVGVFCLLGLFVETRLNTKLKAIGVAAGVVFIFLSWNQTKVWESDRLLWTSSYANEPSPRSLVFNIQYLIEDGHYKEAATEALHLDAWNPGNEDFSFLYGESLYLDPSLDNEGKISALQKQAGKGPWIDYYSAALFMKETRFTEASEAFDRALKEAPRFQSDLPIVVAEANFACLQARKSRCQQETDKLKSTSPFWDEKLFRDRLAELRGIQK